VFRKIFNTNHHKNASKSGVDDILAPHISLGKKGEQLAAQYLTKNHYNIIEMNWRVTIGEADIIAKKKNRVVLVEVKTRRSRHFGYPEESVTAKKRAKLRMLAEIYQKLHNINHFPRIDVISIEYENNAQYQLTHFKDIGWQ